MVKFAEYFLRLENYLYGNNPSNNSSCPSLPAKWCFADYHEYKLCIQNPTLILPCILALLIGLFCSKRISQLPEKFSTRWFYQITFFLYGIMMTSSGIFHCILSNPQKSLNMLENTNEDSYQFIRLLVLVIDVSLSTNIAITVLFCGLCDIRVLNSQSISTRILLFSLYFIVFLLWTLGILNDWNWVSNVLYTGVIGICCFIYLFTQLCIKSNRNALPALFVGGIYGAMGFLAETFGANHICNSEGPFWSQYIGPEFIWDLFSNISMAFVFIYIIRINQEKNKVIEKYPINIEENPEKF